MKIEFSMSSIVVFNTIASGISGGIQYWAKVLQFWVSGRAGNATLGDHPDLDLMCEVVELESGARISLRDRWSTALRLMAERHPREFAQMLTGTGDATTGNVLIQLAAFGEVRYR